jgi:hypothetical protein
VPAESVISICSIFLDRDYLEPDGLQSAREARHPATVRTSRFARRPISSARQSRTTALWDINPGSLQEKGRKLEPKLRGGIRTKTQGIALVSTCHSPRQFPLHPYRLLVIFLAVFELATHIQLAGVCKKLRALECAGVAAVSARARSDWLRIIQEQSRPGATRGHFFGEAESPSAGLG